MAVSSSELTSQRAAPNRSRTPNGKFEAPSASGHEPPHEDRGLSRTDVVLHHRAFHACFAEHLSLAAVEISTAAGCPNMARSRGGRARGSLTRWPTPIRDSPSRIGKKVRAPPPEFTGSPVAECCDIAARGRGILRLLGRRYIGPHAFRQRSFVRTAQFRTAKRGIDAASTVNVRSGGPP